jgi:hypothetical protein
MVDDYLEEKEELLEDYDHEEGLWQKEGSE